MSDTPTLDVPDDAYDGTLASMACVTLPYASDGTDTVGTVELMLGLNHTWIGDLKIKIASPTGTVVTVLSRPGLAEPVDDGTSCCGDGSSIDSFGPIRFRTGGAVDAEEMGAIIQMMLVCIDDCQCDYFPNPGAAVAGDLLSFGGEDAVGDWMVCVGDSANGDVGRIDAVDLVLGTM